MHSSSVIYLGVNHRRFCWVPQLAGEFQKPAKAAQGMCKIFILISWNHSNLWSKISFSCGFWEEPFTSKLNMRMWTIQFCCKNATGNNCCNCRPPCTTPGLVTIVRTQDTKSVFLAAQENFSLFFLSCDQIIPIVVDCRSGWQYWAMRRIYEYCSHILSPQLPTVILCNLGGVTTDFSLCHKVTKWIVFSWCNIPVSHPPTRK